MSQEDRQSPLALQHASKKLAGVSEKRNTSLHVPGAVARALCAIRQTHPSVDTGNASRLGADVAELTASAAPMQHARVRFLRLAIASCCGRSLRPGTDG